MKRITLKLISKHLLWTFLFCISSQLLAAPQKPVDVVLILDSSGSMAYTDVQRLRIQAAKMFVTLLKDEDRAAIIRFSGKATQVTDLLPLQGENEKRVIAAIERVSSAGAHTNIHDALKKGYELLSRQKVAGRQRMIVLMSDGKMDVGQAKRDLELTEKMLAKLGPKFVRERIPVHTVAFSDSSNIPLLRLASEDTKGYFNLLTGKSGIHKIFELLFERTQSPNMLPISNEDSFVIDESIREATIIVTKYKPNSRIELETPHGNSINNERPHPSVSWSQTREFDLITIKNPASGYWRIKFSEGGNKAYIITDMKLEIEAAKEVETNREIKLYAWLANNEKRIKTKKILGATRFDFAITNPQGEVINHQLKAAKAEPGQKDLRGIYATNLTFTSPGVYKFTVTAKNDFFDRRSNFFITVKEPVMTDPFTVVDAHLPVEENADNTTRQPQTQKVAEANNQGLQIKIGANNSEKQTVTADKEKPPEVTSEKPAQAGTDEKNPASTDKHGPEKPEHADTNTTDADHAEEAGEEDSGSGALGIFVTVNLLLLLAGLGYFAYRKFVTRKTTKNFAEPASSFDDMEIDDDFDVDASAEKHDTDEFSDINLESNDEDVAMEEDLDDILGDVDDEFDEFKQDQDATDEFDEDLNQEKANTG